MQSFEEVTALSSLLEESLKSLEESQPKVPAKPSLTPATMMAAPAAASTGGAGTSKAAAKAKDPKAIWDEEEVKAREEVEDESDSRKRPRFDIAYKQRVGTGEVYLGMSDTTPASAHCDEMVVRIELPGSRLADMDLQLTDEHIRLTTGTYKLATYLPRKVRSKEGSAKWDAGSSVLKVTVPIDKGDIVTELLRGSGEE